MKFQSGFKEGLSGEPSDAHNVVVERTVVQSEESPEAESTDLPMIASKGPRDQTQASQLAGTFVLHISPKIRSVKFVSSRKLRELVQELPGCERRPCSSFTKYWRCFHGGSQSSQWGERISVAASLRSRGTGLLFSLDPRLSIEKRNCARHDEKFAKVSAARSENQVLFGQILLSNLSVLVVVRRSDGMLVLFLRNIQDKLADKKSPYERRF